MISVDVYTYTILYFFLSAFHFLLKLTVIIAGGADIFNVFCIYNDLQAQAPCNSLTITADSVRVTVLVHAVLFKLLFISCDSHLFSSALPDGG